MNRPKLRDSKNLVSRDLYPLNIFSKELITDICRHLVYLIYTGKTDISGSDWGDAFANAIHGKHLDSPVGIADVVCEKLCWSMKTVKLSKPFDATTVRLISGRCSPDYSYGITDPHVDVQKTGEAVLNIWNERVNIAMDHFSQVRTTVLVRSPDMLTYRLFEEETSRFRTTDYQWKVNQNGNLIGYDSSGIARFTWQPHGSQFTIHTDVPDSAVRFCIKKPPIIKREDVLTNIGFDESWVTVFPNNTVS